MKTSNILFLLFSITLFSCATTEKKSAKVKPQIVATTGMLYDAVLNIGGNKVTAEVIMGPGVDPHLYKATQGDLSKLSNADIIVYNGILLEGKMSEILDQLGRTKTTVAAAESIPKPQLITHNDHEDAYDPHVWFDVKKWKHAVNTIGIALANYDTINGEYYKKNLNDYLIQLDSLDRYITKRIEEIPESQRILVTAHDAFGYFGEAYGMKVEAVQGMSTVSDFGLKDVINLTDLIIKNNIKSIFVETSVSSKSINAVIAGCQKEGHPVAIGGYLYSDAMGDFGTEEGTYIGMFKKNVNTIVDALK